MTDVFNDAIDAVYSHGNIGAVTATYTPICGGETVSCSIIFENESREQPDGFGAQSFEQIKTIEYRLTEITSEASRGDTFTVDSTVYIVDEVSYNDGYTVKVIVR